MGLERQEEAPRAGTNGLIKNDNTGSPGGRPVVRPQDFNQEQWEASKVI